MLNFFQVRVVIVVHTIVTNLRVLLIYVFIYKPSVEYLIKDKKKPSSPSCAVEFRIAYTHFLNTCRKKLQKN